MRRFVAATVIVLPLVAAACGGGSGHVSLMDEQQCATDWNASNNAASRAAVSRLVGRGYSQRADIFLTPAADIPGVLSPSGCAVVVHFRRQAVAYFARSDWVEDRFAFVSHDLGLDHPRVQRGTWIANQFVYFVPRPRDAGPRRPREPKGPIRQAFWATGSASVSTDGELAPPAR